MINISLEEALERIEKIDRQTREDRAKRLTEIGAYAISLVDRPVANLMGEHLDEAAYSYIYGNFRSCIFSCSAALRARSASGEISQKRERDMES